jgi:hypothetical protein
VILRLLERIEKFQFAAARILGLSGKIMGPVTCVCAAAEPLRGLHVVQRNWIGAASEVGKRRIVGVQLIASGLP